MRRCPLAVRFSRSISASQSNFRPLLNLRCLAITGFLLGSRKQLARFQILAALVIAQLNPRIRTRRSSRGSRPRAPQAAPERRRARRGDLQERPSPPGALAAPAAQGAERAAAGLYTA